MTRLGLMRGRRQRPAAPADRAVELEVPAVAGSAVEEYVRTELPHALRLVEAGSAVPLLEDRQLRPGTALAIGQLTAALNRTRRAAAEDVLQTVLPLLEVLAAQLPHGPAGVARIQALPPGTALMLRLATRAVVLAGGRWPGLCREPEPIGDIAATALAGVPGASRVQLEIGAPYLITAPAVEPLLAATAELADNALRACGPEAHSPVLVATGRIDNGVLPVTVADTGPGLSATALASAQAVAQLRRGVYTASQTALGRGLGLRTIAAAAISADFRVDIHSVPGQGTTARLLLPARLLIDPTDPAAYADPYTAAAPH
ncbi:ATP-binding protein [Kitasatospora sp. NPDC004240]